MTHNLLLDEGVLGDLAGVAGLVEDAVSVEAEVGVHEGHGSILNALRGALRQRVINTFTESL